jgi:hypothetical protein
LIGAAFGGLAVGFAPVAAIKAILGIVLIAAATKVAVSKHQTLCAWFCVPRQPQCSKPMHIFNRSSVASLLLFQMPRLFRLRVFGSCETRLPRAVLHQSLMSFLTQISLLKMGTQQAILKTDPKEFDELNKQPGQGERNHWVRRRGR